MRSLNARVVSAVTHEGVFCAIARVLSRRGWPGGSAYVFLC